MKKMAAMIICGATFFLAFIAFSIGKKEADFWHWAFAKEAVARKKNRCMVVFLINDAYQRGMHRDVQEAYALFKDTIDAIDTKGKYREMITRSEEFTRRSPGQ